MQDVLMTPLFPLPLPLYMSSAQLWVPAARLEAARKCYGTDEDLLLIGMSSASD